MCTVWCTEWTVICAFSFVCTFYGLPSSLLSSFFSTIRGQMWHHRVRGQTIRQTSVCRAAQSVDGPAEVLGSWQRLQPHYTCGCVGNLCVCVCPVYKGFRLICKLSNRDALTEIKSSSQGLALLSRGNGFCLMCSMGRREWRWMAGRGEWGRGKDLGYEREKYK